MSPTDLIPQKRHFLTHFWQILTDFDTFHGDWIGVLDRKVCFSGPWCQNGSGSVKTDISVISHGVLIGVLVRKPRKSLFFVFFRVFSVLSGNHSSMGFGKGFGNYLLENCRKSAILGPLLGPLFDILVKTLVLTKMTTFRQNQPLSRSRNDHF